MNHRAIIRRLEVVPAALRALLVGVTAEEARTRSPAGAWAIVEVLAHLVDEEVEDFRPRLRLTLENPAADWPPIDPEGWALQRAYLAQDLGQLLDRLEAERAESVRWLRSLVDVDWSRAHQHPRFGPIRAGDLLASWAAHDALHLRQIAKRLYERASLDAPGFLTRYAGPWGA
jgi:transposase